MCKLSPNTAAIEHWKLEAAPVLVVWCCRGCTSPAGTPRLLAEHRRVQVSHLSPRRPPEALQGHGEEGSLTHTWGPCPRGGGCASTKQTLSTSARLPRPNRSPEGGKLREGKRKLLK